MRWFILFLAGCLASSAFSGTFSTKANLYGPSVGEVGYGTKVSENFTVKLEAILPVDRVTVPSSAVVGDAVYVDGSGSALLSRADVAGTARVDGLIYEKISLTEARVSTAGRIGGMAGLVAGTRYYLSAVTAGKLVSTPPVPPNLVVDVGVARDTTTLLISRNSDPASLGGDLQDAYDRGASAPTVDLDAGGSITVRDSSLTPLFKVDSPANTIYARGVTAFAGAPLPIKVGSRGIDLDLEGDVGLGTATPTAALDVRQRISSEPATITSGVTGATADLHRWIAADSATPRVRITNDGDIILNAASLVHYASSVPPIITSTPQGAQWMTNGAPVLGYTPNTLHTWSGADWTPGGSGGSGTSAFFYTDIFSPTSGQTAFTLTFEPTSPNGLIFAVVDGATYHEGTSFTFAGTAFTWLDDPVVLGPPDVLAVFYTVGSAPAPTSMNEDVFTATAGQTIFALTAPFVDFGWNLVFVNGIEYDEGTDYTIAGSVMTWLDNPSVLPAGARVTVKYQR